METGAVTGIIHSFETLGAVDGPGLRFVLFLQGCRLRCLYCHNPDTWGFESACARSVTAEEIAREVLKYRNYYGKTGGITVSGGEPLLQIGFLIALFRILKAEGIHTAIDTSGAEYDPGEGRYDELLSLTDLVLLDIKHIDPVEHKKLTGVDNKNILAFAEHLRDLNIPVWIRHVVVPGITYDDDELFRLGEYLSTLTNLKALDVLPYHDMAKPKYENLGIEYPLGDTPPLTKEQAVHARQVIIKGIKSGLKGEHH